jgi:hypothetical protein
MTRFFLMPLLAVLLLGPVATSDVSATPASSLADQVYEARMLGLRVVEGVLLYYNPNYNNHFQDIQAGYHSALKALQLWSPDHQPRSDASVEVSGLVADLMITVLNLDSLDEQAISVRPVYVNRILAAQARLDARLVLLGSEKTTANQEKPESVPDVLLRLGIDVAIQNILYQSKTFGALNFFLLDAGSNLAEQLDKEILASLEYLLAAASESQRPVVEKMDSRYRFVRPHLVGENPVWVPDVVARFCHGISDMISAELAAR